MLFACAVPFLTFFLYAANCVVVFHCRRIRRPILFLGLTFVPYVLAQSFAIAYLVRQVLRQWPPSDSAVLVLTYGLPVLIAVLLCMIYVQFYCLMEFSLSLRMLDHFSSTPSRRMTFRTLRTLYPLEEVLQRKCAAASNVGLLTTLAHEGRAYLSVPPRGVVVLRLVEALARFCNWGDD